jgi:hypothetical protein
VGLGLITRKRDSFGVKRELWVKEGRRIVIIMLIA